MRKIFLKVIPVQPFDCYTRNQFAALVGFKYNDDNDNNIWDHRLVTIPKLFLLTTTKTEAWKKLATQNNLLDGRHNDLMTNTPKLIKV